MKRVALAGLALALYGNIASAQATQVWQGTLFFDTLTPDCISNGLGVPGNFFTVMYRPIIGTGQPGPEGLTLFNATSAQNWQPTSGGSFQTPGSANVVVIGDNGNTGQFTASYALTVKPAKITTTTGPLTISGTMSGWWSVSTCTIGVSAVLERRLN